MIGNIYVLKNSINNKCYVGQTIKTVDRRVYEHYYYNKSVIGKALHKYGRDSFIVYEFNRIPMELLDYFEQELISRLDTIAPNGYNLSLGGQKNRMFSKETIEKMSKAKKGKKITYGWKISIGLKGRIKSELECFHISQGLKGKPKSEAHKKALSKGRTESGIAKGNKNPSARAVRCIEMDEIFSTMKEAAIKYNRTIATICNACRGYTKTCGGFHWEYYKENKL